MHRWLALALIAIAGPAYAGLMLGNVEIPQPPDDVSLPVSTFAVAGYSANAYSAYGFTNPAGSVTTSTNNTNPSTAIKYTASTDTTVPTAITVGEWRDVEVTTFMLSGAILLRYGGAGGSAVCFDYSAGVDTFTVVLLQDITPGTASASRCTDANSNLTLYTTSDLEGEVPGYNATITNTSQFTFGCAGWVCYASLDGTEFWNSGTDLRLPMAAGSVAISRSMRDVDVNWLPLTPIDSDPANDLYAMSDFGFRSVETTGSITASDDELTVADASGFAIGDDVIVECGTEAGACARGTVGVGGTWPALHYANDAAMDAAVPCTSGDYAYADDTNKARQCLGASWAAWSSTLYYYNFKSPISLSATITNIAGNVLTLDTAASATATGANVYLDSTRYMDMFDNNVQGDSDPFTPIGTYQFGENIVVRGDHNLYLRNGTTRENGIHLKGQGMNKITPVWTFYVPDGTAPLSLVTYQTDYVTIQDMYSRSNLGPNRYGYAWSLTNPNSLGAYLNPGSYYLRISTGGEIKDSGWYNSFRVATTDGCTGCSLTRLYGRSTVNQQMYSGWAMQQTNSTDGDITDSELDFDYVRPGFEIFRSDNVDIIRPIGRNALISDNSSGGDFLWDEVELTFTEDSLGVDNYMSNLEIMINFNTNAGGDAGVIAQGGEMRNPTIIMEGYMDTATFWIPKLIQVSQNNPLIRITGTYPTCSSPKGLIDIPDWVAGTAPLSAWDITIRGDNNTISGLRITNIPESGYGQINVTNEASGTVVTDVVMDHAVVVQPPETVTETGTISNATYEADCAGGSPSLVFDTPGNSQYIPLLPF